MTASCSIAPPHRFLVISDADMAGIEANFANSRATRAILHSPRSGEVTVEASDSAGTIMLEMADASRVECRVGYVTNGEIEPHRATIRDGKCDVAI